MQTRIQQAPFDAAAEAARLTAGRSDMGALVTFTGLVRGEPGSSLTLEHYPGMTERQMAEIAAEAARRWPAAEGIAIHRYGELHAGEPIVLVAITAPHRADAFRAAEFLMDWLKTKAPFWKRETDAGGNSRWVEARTEDGRAADRWG